MAGSWGLSAIDLMALRDYGQDYSWRRASTLVAFVESFSLADATLAREERMGLGYNKAEERASRSVPHSRYILTCEAHRLRSHLDPFK